jgi:hypothetical protein
MFITHSVAFDPLRPAEVETMRRLARAERDFAVAAKRASRLTFLAATLTGRLDPEAALGLRVSEADAIVALARTPARTKTEREWKAGLIRSWRNGAGGDPLLEAMLDAALEADRPKAVGRAARTGAERERS